MHSCSRRTCILPGPMWVHMLLRDMGAYHPDVRASPNSCRCICRATWVHTLVGATSCCNMILGKCYPNVRRCRHDGGEERKVADMVCRRRRDCPIVLRGPKTGSFGLVPSLNRHKCIVVPDVRAYPEDSCWCAYCCVHEMLWLHPQQLEREEDGRESRPRSRA